MINIKSTSEISKMRAAGKVVFGTFKELEKHIKPGITTKQLDKIAHDYICAQGAEPSFLGYAGYPASICASINDTVIHGIPDDTALKDGDIISLDIGAVIDGYHGDAARTYPVGKISDEAQRLIDVTKQSFFEGLKFARHNERLFSISATIQDYIESNGYSIVRNYCGHGIGKKLHEDPEIPNHGIFGRGVRLCKGMTIAVEPMVNAGGFETKCLSDGWTVKTKDGSLACHYENTILITDGEPELLTLIE
ncbi:MAG: type I methionyl aminopeptidase [Ruminococcaceae bacterium]|nr:type I methionyl aminopeptidase [Oscillospiraceae bacterium]